MPTRRRLLAAVGCSLSAVAGCSDDPSAPTPEDDPGQAGGTPSPDRETTRIDSETETPTDTPTATETEAETPADAGAETNATQTGETPSETPTDTPTETPTDTPTETPTPTPQTELDLREANVVDVTVEATDGAYRFDVTLIHDDDGESGRADWWQVEDGGGTRLGRRELAHAHGTREFTRSGTVSVPSGVACVVVRGHDQTHGYGGRVVLVNVETGATAGVRQGGDPVSNAELARSCP